MTLWNLRQACLLESSGELRPAERKELLDHLAKNPAAHRQYEDIKAGLELLRELPYPEPSARLRRTLPARIKLLIRAQMAGVMLRRRAQRRVALMRYAVAAALAVILMLLWAVQAGDSSALRRNERAQMTRLNADIDRLALAGRHAGPDDQALIDVEASIRQLQTESPTLASVHDQDMSRLLDVLATVPLDLDDALPSEPG